jgi:hypothetical protein
LDRSAKRLFYLRVESDPTAEATPRPGVSQPKPVPAEPRRTIPDLYTNGVAFPISRDEALYDMHNRPSRFDQWRDKFTRHADFERWQQLLWGKTLDEQLWTVRPPKGMFRDARVRCWAETTLAAAGYDKASMLPEWEIYWRRQGQ